MSVTDMEYTLAELCIAAAAEAWRADGELLASGFGMIPRLAAGAARLCINPALLITGAEAYLVDEPVPVGPRNGREPALEGWMPYARTFELLWHGRRHAMLSPVQMDRHGQMNLSVIGSYARPKVALLGVRGLPGNSIHHRNSAFVPNHSTRVFVGGEVDVVCSVGYNRARWPDAIQPRWLDLHVIVTDLAVLDFGGPNHQVSVRSLHPGVSFEQVQDCTGFPLARAASIAVTAPPSEQMLAVIREQLDPGNERANVFEGNPTGDRRSDR